MCTINLNLVLKSSCWRKITRTPGVYLQYLICKCLWVQFPAKRQIGLRFVLYLFCPGLLCNHRVIKDLSLYRINGAALPTYWCSDGNTHPQVIQSIGFNSPGLANSDRQEKFLIRHGVGMGTWLSGAPVSHTKSLKTSLGMANDLGLHNSSPEV